MFFRYNGRNKVLIKVKKTIKIWKNIKSNFLNCSFQRGKK